MVSPNVAEAFVLDANGNPISYQGMLFTKKTIAYTGAASLGAQGATTLFTVTGDVIATVFAVCSESLAGANATIEVGVSGDTACFIAQSTGTDIDNGEVWVDTAPGKTQPIPAAQVIAGGADIIETIATADITDGTLTYYCAWAPLTVGASVVAA